MKGTLYLIPSLLGDTEVGKVIPAFNNELVLSIKYYVAEDVRTVRRFLKKANKTINIDDDGFFKYSFPTASIGYGYSKYIL